jgi:hypothetical protein
MCIIIEPTTYDFMKIKENKESVSMCGTQLQCKAFKIDFI